jgi:UDP-4-amino-4,6-dideoxy-N-acetyl-beta-L-altrosamine transaminase
MIPYGRHHIDEADIQAVVDVLRRGELTQGPTVEAFERAVADYVGARYAVAVSSCTAGLHLAAMAAGVGPGTALVTSPITFVASANAALYCGAQPLFADIDPDTVNMSPASLRDTLQRHSNVRAVIPVHFGGLPCDMPAIHEVAAAAGVIVIEDAAHAIGATYPDGTRVGCCAHSLMTVFSFHPVKAIASGEGGMITTNDTGVYRRLLRLRSHGINKLDDVLQAPEQSSTNGVRDPWYYEMQELGYHFRITDIQCALGLSQFGKLDMFLSRRRALVRTYDAAFAGSQVLRPAQTTGREASGHHIYVARLDFEALGTTRHAVMKALRAKGIVTQVHYIPVPAHPHYRRLGFRPEDYPAAAVYYSQALTIPLYFDLTDQEQQLVITSVTALVS